MADLNAATASDPAIVTDVEAVSDLLERYSFGNLTVELEHVDAEDTIEAHSKIAIWGYDWWQAWPVDPVNGTVYDVSRELEFLCELSRYIAPGETLDIQSAGATKCRYPVYAHRWLVQPERVFHSSLTDDLEDVTLDDWVDGNHGAEHGADDTPSATRQAHSTSADEESSNA